MGPMMSLTEDLEKMDMDQPRDGVPLEAEPQAPVLPSSRISTIHTHLHSNTPAYAPAYLKMSAGIGRKRRKL